MKRLSFLVLVLFLSACGNNEDTSRWGAASKIYNYRQVMLLNLRAGVDGVTSQMPLMQSFSYSGIEMEKNDTTISGDKYGTETYRVEGYGTVVIRPVRPIEACKDQPLPSEHRIENAFLGDSMSEPPCDCLVHYDGPKGIDVIYNDEKGLVLTVVNSVKPWGMLPRGNGKVMVYANQTKKKIVWKKKCPPEQRCSGKCVDLNTDYFNCGACGYWCQSNMVCQDGKCQCPSGSKWCVTGYGKRCVDVKTSRQHCGGCGLPCSDYPVYEVCENGYCVEEKCLPSEVKCGWKCTDLNTDNFHCGACDNVCSATQTCQAGKCLCPPGFTECGVTCRNLMTDPGSCGACYEKCDTAAGKTCVDGKCV